jgi:hypothetical protein
MDGSNNALNTIPLGNTCGKSTITQGLTQCTSSPTTVSYATFCVMTAQIVYTLSIITNIIFAFVKKGQPVSTSPTTKAPVSASPTSTAPVTNSPTSTSGCLGSFNKIKIQATNTTFIQFYELQVISGGINVAVNKAASQSSTINPYVASRGVDGSSTTFSHTKEGSAEWFQVDLGATVTADSIVILNRDCVANPTAQCLCRMSNANLIFMDASNNQVATIPLGDTCGKDTITTFTQCS